MKLIFLFAFVFCSLTMAHDFSLLEGKEVPKQPFCDVPWSSYLIPNEFEPGNFNKEELNAARGLLVSVGTFRTLIIFAWAENITHLLMTDVDERVAQFNRNHLNYIAYLAYRHADNPRKQRMQYMANFLYYEPNDEELTVWAQENKSIDELRATISEKKAELGKFNDDNVFMKNEIKELWFKTNLNANNLFSYVRVNNERFYWEDDIQWKKIIDALQKSQIAVTNLSLTTDITLLNEFIEQIAIPFGAMDVSNIPNFRQNPISNREWSKALEKLSPHKVLYTKSIGVLKFSYTCCDFDIFLAFLDISASL